jgi:hypothetical protein
MLRIYINCLISCVFEGLTFWCAVLSDGYFMVCRVESWILHGVPRVEEGCGTLA